MDVFAQQDLFNGLLVVCLAFYCANSKNCVGNLFKKVWLKHFYKKWVAYIIEVVFLMQRCLAKTLCCNKMTLLSYKPT